MIKFYNLYIDFEPSWITYNRITEIIGQTPKKHERSKFDKTDEPSIWWLQLVEDEKKDHFIDFINVFMDLIEPNISKLEKIGIKKDNILIWLVYEYEQQCSLGFNPKELERLGINGISFNIDCIEKRK